MFMPGVWILWSRKKFLLLFFKKKMEILLHFLSFLFWKVFKKCQIAQIYYYDPQFAGINLQSPQSDSTPWTLTLLWGLVLLSDFLIPIFIPYKPLCISRLGCGCRFPWRMTIISEHKGVINFHLTTREDGNELWKKIGSTSLSWVAAGTHNGFINFLNAYSNYNFVKCKKEKKLWFCEM